MLSTIERVRRVKLRAGEMRSRREKKHLQLLSGLCASLLIGIGAEYFHLLRGGEGTVQGMNGAMLMFEDAEGYVLVGILSFAAAVVITLVCIRYRDYSKNKKQRMEDERREKTVDSEKEAP